MSDTRDMSQCPGCGLRLTESPGLLHAYVTTSPECWALFAESLPAQTERLFTDAYMAQHPDGNDPRQVQSVASHLIALESVLVGDQPRAKTAEILVAAVALGRQIGGFRILTRPREWPSNIGDVIEERTTATRYVSDVLASWHSVEGDQISLWAKQTLEELYG